MVKRGKGNGKVLYRSITSMDNSFTVNVYRRADGKFYIYKTFGKGDFPQEEFIGKCASDAILDIFISNQFK